ncbi:hypothetical protein [Paenibacillus phytorum]|nr:hypothetical protein [Paenibacillus phytorum]
MSKHQYVSGCQTKRIAVLAPQSAIDYTRMANFISFFREDFDV